MVKVVEISKGIFWVGVEDKHRRIFDSLITLPYGTSYNSYLVVGKDKTALIDTVNPGFEKEFFKKIGKVVNPEKIDYLIMNHAEPDHAGGISEVLSKARYAKLVATQKGAEMAGVFHGVPPERTMVVRDGDTLDLGGKTLKFIEAPWLHWPETMFTYCEEDGVLFSCDFFGSHIASNRLFDDEFGDILHIEAKRYYSEIMMPFNKFVSNGLDKVKEIDVRMVAPSHGPIYKNPRRIIDAYEKWARGPLEQKVVVVYVSMWGNTEAMAKIITDAILKEGVEAVSYNAFATDVSYIARDLVDASAVVVGSPTLLGGVHPVVGLVVSLIKALRPRLKYAAIFGSYGWGGGAVDRIKTTLQSAGLEIMDVSSVRGKPKKEDFEKAENLGKLVAQKVKEIVKIS
ncbi:MAG: MBL fold hydrolase [Hadesarchaea archaeon CG08_land_8_20_14_0_20_51_8]|nr:MAG: MBL fold hydrolase [Hadesarchaea archaeon CG08_land_8_20_14_0_20_51_8]